MYAVPFVEITVPKGELLRSTPASSLGFIKSHTFSKSFFVETNLLHGRVSQGLQFSLQINYLRGLARSHRRSLTRSHRRNEVCVQLVALYSVGDDNKGQATATADLSRWGEYLELVEGFGVFVEDHVGQFGGAGGGDFAVVEHSG